MRTTLSLVFFAVGCGLLAASALASVSQAPPANTFRLALTNDIDYVDPTLAYYAPTWALMYATGAQLYNYPDAPAPRGSRLQPEVAVGFPKVSKDGRTYTIRLKNTYRFSDGERVTALNFAWAINRALDRRMASPAQPFVADIVGAKDVINGRARLARGVLVPDRYTLRIRLERKAPDILARLAMPFFQAIPETLPINGEGIRAPVPSAGPYFIKGWTMFQGIVLERNRYYRGPRPHRVQRIDVRTGLPLETVKLNIDRGTTDGGDVPTSAAAELARRHGVRRRSPGRYFVNPTAQLVYLAFNHDRRLFGGPGTLGNVPLKKAVNLAIDRRRLMLLLGAQGGSVTDQLLPPTFRAFRDWELYPRRPKLAEARRLADGALRSTRAQLYCSNRAALPQMCESVEASLREIGLHVAILLFPGSPPRVPPESRGNPFDMAMFTDRAAGLRPSDPETWFDRVNGTTIKPTNNVNLSYFDDERFNRRIRRAARLSGARRDEAFAELDRDVMRRAAPIAPIGYLNDRHYVSARVGCYHHHPVYGWNFGAICLRR